MTDIPHSNAGEGSFFPALAAKKLPERGGMRKRPVALAHGRVTFNALLFKGGILAVGGYD